MNFWQRWSRRGKWERELSEELRDHFEKQVAANVAAGIPADEARRQATLQFGAVEGVKENCREQRSGFWLETLIADARYALRVMRKNPGFAAVAVLTLAVGIGANTAIFSVVYAVLLKPLPFAQPEQLFNVFEVQPAEGVKGTGWSYGNFEELRATNHIFSQMSGHQEHQLTLTGRGEPTVVNTAVVTPELFSVMGVKPLAGRTFLPEEGKPGAPAVVVLSEKLWRGTFGADANIIGSAITLDKRPCTVVGIMPEGFRFPAI